MNRQISLSALSDELSQARTKKKEFLEQMDRIIPWSEWIGKIKPHYYSGKRGNKPFDLELMLRIHVLQNLYELSDMGAMGEVIDSRAFSDFCGIDSRNQVPDGDTIGRFRALLVEHGLQKELFTQVVELLLAKGLMLKKGSIVDSTIISAPSSTKNREKKRDPDAHQTKKGNTWHFGYKGHIGVDKFSGLVHHVEVTAANVHDVSVMPQLLHDEEEKVWGDSGYLGADKREDAITHNHSGKKIQYKINRRPSQSKNNSARSKGQIKRREREKSSVRAKVEHVFAVVKGLFGYRKTRYKGRRKQTAKLNMMFALANLFLADKRFGLAV
jgi:IS5 family transposase